MDLQRLIHAIVRKIWLVIICAFVGSLLFGYASLSSKPVYQTETTLYIINRSSSILSGSSINLQDITLSRQLISDYANIILTRKVLDPALKELNNDAITDKAIGSAISVNLKKDSNVMSIAVNWPNAEQAANIANAVSRSFANQISKLTNNNSIGILDEAQIPVYPLPSSRGKTIVIGLLAGMMIAIGIIYVRELFDSTIRSASEIEDRLDLKVIGVIPENSIS